MTLDFSGIHRSPICEPPPPPPPLSAHITGPSLISSKGTYTWSAFRSGGTGYYTYLWRMRDVGGSWYNLGTTQNQNHTVYSGDPDFDLELRVVSGTETMYDTLRVTNCIGVPGCQY